MIEVTFVSKHGKLPPEKWSDDDFFTLSTYTQEVKLLLALPNVNSTLLDYKGMRIYFRKIKEVKHGSTV